MVSKYGEDINKLKMDLAGMRKDISYIKKNIDNLNKCLNGNGQPGIVQKLNSLETFRDKIVGALIVINMIWAVILYLIGVS